MPKIRGRALEPRNPELLLRTIQLYHMAQAAPPAASPAQPAVAGAAAADQPAAAPAAPSPLVARVLAEEAEGLLGAGGLDGAVAELVKLAEDPAAGSLGARVCAARALALVTAPAEEGREKAVRIVREGLQGRGVTVPACAAAVEAVRSIAGSEGGGPADELRGACAKIFPAAETFGASPADTAAAAATAPSG